MSGRTFVDTNIWFYAVDHRDPSKYGRAHELLPLLFGDGSVVVSGQVVLELAANLIKKLNLPADQTRSHLEVLQQAECVAVSPSLIDDALILFEQYSLTVWDAAILAAALEAGCDVLLTEDLQHGLRIGPLQIVNPFL